MTAVKTPPPAPIAVVACEPAQVAVPPPDQGNDDGDERHTTIPAHAWPPNHEVLATGEISKDATRSQDRNDEERTKQVVVYRPTTAAHMEMATSDIVLLVKFRYGDHRPFPQQDVGLWVLQSFAFHRRRHPAVHTLVILPHNAYPTWTPENLPILYEYLRAASQRCSFSLRWTDGNGDAQPIDTHDLLPAVGTSADSHRVVMQWTEVALVEENLRHSSLHP